MSDGREARGEGGGENGGEGGAYTVETGAATGRTEEAGRAGRTRPSGLSERDVAVLAMAGRGWQGPGAKERAIRERLGMSPTRFYQLLNALLDDPHAVAHDPVTVNRLRRSRDEQRARRDP